MEIKITMEIVKQNGMVAGVGTCSLDEAWIVPHVKAIAEEYAKRNAGGCSCECDCDEDEDEVEDEIPVCPYCEVEVPEGERLTLCINGDDKEYCPECGELVDPEDWE